jgi:hypothetical protein
MRGRRRRQGSVASASYSQGLTSPWAFFRTFSPATRQDPRRRSAGSRKPGSSLFSLPNPTSDDQGMWRTPSVGGSCRCTHFRLYSFTHCRTTLLKVTELTEAPANGMRKRRRCRGVVGKLLPRGFPTKGLFRCT